MAKTTMKQRMSRLSTWFWQTLPGNAIARFAEIEAMSMAAALTFYTVLSLAPLILLLLWLTASLYPAAQEQFFQQLNSLVGGRVEEMARTVVDNAERRPGMGSFAGIFGTITLLVSATAVFGQLQYALNKIFHAHGERSGIWGVVKKRLVGMGMLLGIGFLLIVSMIGQAVITALTEQMSVVVPVLTWAFSFVLYSLAFAALYWLLPDRDVDWKHSLLGGAITSALFVVGRWGIGLYLGQSDMGSAYGPAGGLFVLLVWMYYSSLIFFMGAILTAVLCERARRRSGAPVADDGRVLERRFHDRRQGTDRRHPDDPSFGHGQPA